MAQNSGIQIITFQITPYSDSVADYINSLSEEKIYGIFQEDAAANILTAALYAIYKLESTALNIISNKQRHQTITVSKEINASYILRLAQQKCSNSYLTIDHKVLVSLGDIYLRDELLFKENINNLAIYPNVFVLIIDGIYSGHIYAWTVENINGPGRVTNVIGFRTSLYQLLIDTCRLRHNGFVPIFMNAIQVWALNQDSQLIKESEGKREVNIYPHYIRFLQPIGPIPGLLSKCGFIITKNIGNELNKTWLFDNGSIGDIPLARMLVFRNYDYIVHISNELQCKILTYQYKEL